MTPNPTANPLAILSTNASKPGPGLNQGLETSDLDSVDGPGPGTKESNFLDILQLLNVPTPADDALMPALQLADNPETLTPEPGQVNLGALPEAMSFIPQQAGNTGTGELPPQSGRSLPPAPQQTPMQLLGDSAGEPSLPAPTAAQIAATPTSVQPLIPGSNLATENTIPGSLSDTAPLAPGTTTPPLAESGALFRMPNADAMQAVMANAQQNLTPAVAESAVSNAVLEEPGVELVRMPTGQAAHDKPGSIQNATPVLTLARPAGTPGWDQGLGQRILWMVENGLGKAELRLDPPHLGSINVRITMLDDQAHMVFKAAHPAAREALESAMPRLREMFAEQEIQLGDADVRSQDERQPGDHEPHDRSGETTDGSMESSQQATNGDTGAEMESAARIRRGVTEYNLVDEFV